MTINNHYLVHSYQAGNGYHGNCKYCGMALVTDLGYCSWNDTKCVDREITYEGDIPKNVLSYARFRGYRWDHKRFIFVILSNTFICSSLKPASLNTCLNSSSVR